MNKVNSWNFQPCTLSWSTVPFSIFLTLCHTNCSVVCSVSVRVICFVTLRLEPDCLASTGHVWKVSVNIQGESSPIKIIISMIFYPTTKTFQHKRQKPLKLVKAIPDRKVQKHAFAHSSCASTMFCSRAPFGICTRPCSHLHDAPCWKSASTPMPLFTEVWEIIWNTWLVKSVADCMQHWIHDCLCLKQQIFKLKCLQTLHKAPNAQILDVFLRPQISINL